MTRMPVSAMAARTFWSAEAPSAPISEKPDEKMVATFTPAAAASRKVSATDSAGTTMRA